MKAHKLLFLPLFLFATNNFAQVQQVIDDLIGSYTPYLLTDACLMPTNEPLPEIIGIEITLIENTETVGLNYTVQLPDTSYMVSDIIEVNIVEDSTGTNVELDMVFPVSLFNYAKLTGSDSLTLMHLQLCAACSCGFGYLVSKEMTTSVKQDDLNSWTIYPNPATNYISVEKENNILRDDARITIFDRLGKIVYFEELSESKIQIPLIEMSEGIYFLKLEEGSQVETKQFIKIY